MPTWALPFSGHVSTANQYVWGLTVEANKAIHSEIIDKVPWRGSYGGWEHRELWGHTDAWYYEGQLPEEAVLQDIRRANPSFSDIEIQRTFREAVSMTGQDRIAGELRRQFPNLSQREAMAAAEQVHAAHIIGDSATAEGFKLTNAARARKAVSSPSLDAVRAKNKMAVFSAVSEAEAKGSDFDLARFIGQSANFERLKVEEMMTDNPRLKAYNLAGRGNIGVTLDNVNYIYKKDRHAAQRFLRRNTVEISLMLDDEYVKFINNKNNVDLLDRAFPESKITGKTNTLQGSQTQLAEHVTIDQAKLASAQTSFANAVRQKMKQVAPYALGGALMAISENWEILNAAYQGEEEWEKALKRTGRDFAGYTVTPMVVDGVLAQMGDKVAIIAPLKDAGVGYTIGYWVWGSGK